MTKELATQFLTQKVAKIIYDSVECSLADRSLTDWTEAERIVRERLGGLLGTMGYVSGLPLVPTFEEFDARLGHAVWLKVQDELPKLPQPPYGRLF